MRARDIMSTPAVTVSPDTPVKSAEAVLAHEGFTALPVLNEDDQLVGIVTEADFVGDRFAVEFGNSPARRIGEMMTTSVQTADVNADVVTLARSMVRNGIRSMPVLDRGRVIGVVTRRDFLRVLARPDQLLANDVRVRLAVFGEKDRWTVDVHDGEAMITDRFDSEADRQVATVLAEGVPGVIRARCHVGELAEGQT